MPYRRTRLTYTLGLTKMHSHHQSSRSRPPLQNGIVACAVSIAALMPHCAKAATWVQYYRTGTIIDGKTIWDSYQIDKESVAGEGDLIKYFVRFVDIEGKVSDPTEMRANCKDGSRGQLPELRLYSTYKGTIGGEEVKFACSFYKQGKE